MKGEDYLTVAEVAERLGRSQVHVYRMIQIGALGHTRAEDGIRVYSEDVRRILLSDLIRATPSGAYG